MSRMDVDVLVIGLGPAGARAAAGSAARGCRVVAVERRREAGIPVQCAEFVPAMIGAEVADMGACVRQHIEAMETFVESGGPERTAPFPGQMIDRAAFDARLAAEAAQAGADCRFGTSVREVSALGAATLSDGTRVVPRMIVGADGPRSVAGRAIGRVNRALVETRQVTVALRGAHPATDIFLSAAIPGGYGWMFPKGEVANVGAGVAPAHKPALKAVVEALHARLAGEGRVGSEVLSMTGGAIPVGGALDPVGLLGTVPVLLAGDAAGLANPVTGAGIAAAVFSGDLAAEAAADWIGGDALALDEYREELEALLGAALARALARRKELLRATPSPAALRRGWIAYPDYWNGAPR